MILFALVAMAETPVDLESRLLGETPVITPAVAAPASSSPSLLGMGGALGLLALGIGLWKREGGRTTGSSSLQIVGKHQLPQGTLVLVDVEGLDGARHRLLLGAGSAGPRLLADVSFGLANLGEEEA